MPSMLFGYHNSIHARLGIHPTGYCLGVSPETRECQQKWSILQRQGHKDLAERLYEGFRNAEIAMEKQRQVMIRQDLDGNMFTVGDQVKVDVKHHLRFPVLRQPSYKLSL
jgi:hypothetical protein